MRRWGWIVGSAVLAGMGCNSGHGALAAGDEHSTIDMGAETPDIDRDEPMGPPEGFEYDPCGAGPTLLESGMFVRYGCAFLNHAYKIKHNGVMVTGDLQVCDSGDTCIQWLEYQCGGFWLCNDGTRDIIIGRDTGIVNTHARSHSAPEALPHQLVMPLEVLPAPVPAPWNR